MAYNSRMHILLVPFLPRPRSARIVHTTLCSKLLMQLLPLQHTMTKEVLAKGTCSGGVA